MRTPSHKWPRDLGSLPPMHTPRLSPSHAHSRACACVRSDIHTQGHQAHARTHRERETTHTHTHTHTCAHAHTHAHTHTHTHSGRTLTHGPPRALVQAFLGFSVAFSFLRLIRLGVNSIQVHIPCISCFSLCFSLLTPTPLRFWSPKVLRRVASHAQ